MPYKERLKQAEGKPRKRRKPGYRVTNARAYNQSLKRRGMVSLYFCGGDLKAQFINARTHTPGVSGGFVRMGTSSLAADATIHF